jgi:predicted  nucleic acid-binding Zn-ribbon protein
MQEELDALTAKLTELAGRVRALREENLQLRAQILAASNELEQMRSRVANAMQRIDALIERLPAQAPADAQE